MIFNVSAELLMPAFSLSIQIWKASCTGLRFLLARFFIVSVLVVSLFASGALIAEENENSGVYAAAEKQAQDSVSSKIHSKLLRAQGLADPEQSLVGNVEGSSPGVRPGVGFSDWIRMLLSLLFIVGLIFILAWLVRRFNGGVLPSNQDIKVISSVSLSHKEKLITVQVEDQRLLLAVSPSGINKLTTLGGKPNERSKSDPSDS